MQTVPKETSTTYFSEEATTTPRIWYSAEEEITKYDAKQPGGYLVWVKRLPSGRSTIHGCRVHHTVESSIVEESGLTINSRLDSYEPPISTIPVSGCIPFSSPISVYAPKGGNPTVVCLSTTIEMIGLDSFGSESKPSEIQLHDRPTRIVSGKFEGQQLASICTKMMGGNVVFHLAAETADLSSSSLSSSSSYSS